MGRSKPTTLLGEPGEKNQTNEAPKEQYSPKQARLCFNKPRKQLLENSYEKKNE